FDRLTEIAVREHALERDAAEDLAHDILFGFMSRAGRIPNPTQWLDASMRQAGKHIRRTAGER
ncbi:MAG: hypothetical protein QOJ98_3121, partial [Acidobacteriota bacterium]|nr:hypothetical protein [Acidobacteriota bacterium]